MEKADQRRITILTVSQSFQVEASAMPHRQILLEAKRLGTEKPMDNLFETLQSS
jgi:hypothetical protein